VLSVVSLFFLPQSARRGTEFFFSVSLCALRGEFIFFTTEGTEEVLFFHAFYYPYFGYFLFHFLEVYPHRMRWVMQTLKYRFADFYFLLVTHFDLQNPLKMQIKQPKQLLSPLLDF
jgi:hypothetical protein